jgi:hypothetical protein
MRLNRVQAKAVYQLYKGMRLPRARLEQSDRWSALRAAFQARDVDPRLRRQSWLADLLLDRAPAGGYPPASGGMLDLETAWRAFWEQVLQLTDGRADAAALLRWTLDPAALNQFMNLPDQARMGIDPVVPRLTRSGQCAAARAPRPRFSR